MEIFHLAFSVFKSTVFHSLVDHCRQVTGFLVTV